MRLSANRGSPFYFGTLVDRGISPSELCVSINGMGCTLVVEADSDEGWADVIALDDRGRPQWENEQDPRVKLLRVFGQIEFRVGDLVLT